MRARLFLQRTQLGAHQIDLRLLTRDDRSAERPDLRIRDWRLLAHQDGSAMMGNHRSQKLPVRNAGLEPNQQERRDADDKIGGDDGRIALLIVGAASS